jgi:hypothetical protein
MRCQQRGEPFDGVFMKAFVIGDLPLVLRIAEQQYLAMRFL